MKLSVMGDRRYLSPSFPIQSGLKQEEALSSLLSNFALEYAIRNVNDLGLDMNSIHLLLTYTDDVNLIGDDIRTIESNADLKMIYQ